MTSINNKARRKRLKLGGTLTMRENVRIRYKMLGLWRAIAKVKYVNNEQGN